MASERHWREIPKWQKRAAKSNRRERVFCASMCDVFELSNSPEDAHRLALARERLWSLIKDTPDLDWLLLTKRPSNVRELTPDSWLTSWPCNTWLGISASTQDDLDRNAPYLLETPAAVRFLSLEPLLEPIDLSRWFEYNPPHRTDSGLHQEQITRYPKEKQGRAIHLVIIGAESGPRRRECDNQWIASIVRQCVDSDTPVFVKQAHEGRKVIKMPEIMGRVWDQVPSSSM
jgi:protein gp37